MQIKHRHPTLQPLDQGIITTVITHYSPCTFRTILDACENCAFLSVSEFWEQYFITVCILSIKEPVNELDSAVVNGC
jgi:hypothetical protein